MPSVKSINNKKVLIVGIDTQILWSLICKELKECHLPNALDPSATLLGAEQWDWLKMTSNDSHDLLILASSIQVIPTEHRFEKWSNIPAEREKLINY